MPSPVLMLALVVNGKTLPHPPVASTTARAVIAWIRPVAQLDGDDPVHPPVVDEQAGDEPLVVPRHPRVLQGGLEQRVQHVEAGLVGREPGAHLLHAAEGAHRHPAVRLPAPRAAPVLELQELARRLVDERLDGVLVAQPVAPGDRVVDVLVEGVALCDHPGRAALGRHRVAAHGVDLRHDGHVEPRFGLGDGDARPGGRPRRRRPGARRGRRPRGHHSPRSSSSTSTLPWWSTICRWTLPSWNSSRWLWHPQE